MYSTPAWKICSNAHGFLALDVTEQFDLPSVTNFAFGIHLTDISLLAFDPRFSVRVEHHRLKELELDSITIGDTIRVDNTTADRALRLFRFVSEF